MAAEIAISTIVVGSILIFWMNGLEMNDKHPGIKLLFNLMSLWSVVLGANIAIEMAIGDALTADVISNLTTFYNVVLWVVIFTTAYWVFMFIKDVVMNMTYFKNRQRNEILDQNEE